MLSSLRETFENIAENSQIWTWALFSVLTSAMFMTHGYAKLFGDNPQSFRGAQ
jgi:uncharacterized membrane protein YphA (DoxX/SURF4 family)